MANWNLYISFQRLGESECFFYGQIDAKIRCLNFLTKADTLLEENLSLGQQIEQLLQENEKLREEILRQSIFEKSKSNVSQQPEVHVKFAIYMNFCLVKISV